MTSRQAHPVTYHTYESLIRNELIVEMCNGNDDPHPMCLFHPTLEKDEEE